MELPEKPIFDIDLDELDIEWVRHAAIFAEQVEAQAEARLEWEEAKLDLIVIDAELNKSVRDNPKKFGITKVTEKSIEAAVLQSQSHFDAVQAVNDARYHHDLISGRVTALEHKKRALENLVSLHGQNYFSTPSTKKAHRDSQTRLAEKIENKEKSAVRKPVRRRKKSNV